MSCIADAKEAIIDAAFREMTDGRHTFDRVGDDMVRVNGKQDNGQTRAESRVQARAIAKSLSAKISKSFNNQVKAFVVDEESQPVRIKLVVSDAYAQHELDRQEQQERDYINTDTGPKTFMQLALFAPVSSAPTLGVFEKYVQFKKNLFTQLNQRLGKIEEKEKDKSLTVAELTKLKNLKREVKLLLEGKQELGIKGLRQDIADLQKAADINALGPYIEKDLKRLERLAQSNDIDDIREAESLVSFYNLVGTFDFSKRDTNPFFTAKEIFLEDQNGELTAHFKLDDATRAQCEAWRQESLKFNNQIEKRKEEITVDEANAAPGIVQTFKGRKLSYEELTSSDRGLRDTDWVSMWTMDITSGIWSHNGLLPQVMFSTLVNHAEKELAWSRDIEERVNHLNPNVQKELVAMGYSLRGSGILGLNGASYQLFKEITKEGNETGGLVRRYGKEFFDAQSKAIRDFWNSIYSTRASAVDDATKRRLSNKASETLKSWRRNNTIALNFNSLPEITSDPEFASIVTPVTDSHKQDLIDILGQKGYDQEVDNQKVLLRKYLSEKQSTLETALILEGKATYADLTPKTQSDLQFWEENHNPNIGLQDYHAVSGVYMSNRKVNNVMDYNSFIPRKFTTTIAANTTTDKYEFTDTTKETGNYSQAFAKIEANQTLSQFHDVISEVIEHMRQAMPIELQEKLAPNSIPALMKTSTEILADRNNGILSSLVHAFQHMWERLRVGFGVRKQSELSFAVKDPITGKVNYKVNDSFFRDNATAIHNMIYVERVKFLQAFNTTMVGNNIVQNIKAHSVLDIKRFNDDALVMLGQYLHVDISLADIKARNLTAITNITGQNVQIGKYIRDFSMHSIVQTQSFDLGKIAKYFSNMTAMYSARQKSLPILEIMKKHYEDIKKPDTNNLDKQKYHVPDNKHMTLGFRTNAIKQVDDWFDRVALDNYGLKHTGVGGQKNKGNVIPLIGESIYTVEERRRFEELGALAAKEPDVVKKAELLKMQENLGRTRTFTALMDNIYAWIRTMRLGYNVASATTNLIEGITSNLILAENGEYFDPKEMYYGYAAVKHSFLKNLTFGAKAFETNTARKVRMLMDKFNVLMDSKNELQKSSIKSFSSKFSWATPLELNNRVEYINQSPIMIAMLRTIKIKDANGVESSVWDAMDVNGDLVAGYDTPENQENWHEMKKDQYLNFKQKLHKVIVLGHGNYDTLRGMMSKSNTGGKGLMMFKTWLPMQLYWRFATEQDDIQLGTAKFKGRYRSYGAATGFWHGAAVGMVSMGPIGALAVGGITALGAGVFGTHSDVNMLQQSIEMGKQLFKRCIGMPVNLASGVLVGKRLINTGDQAFDKFIGKGDFTEQDARNMRANMADISMQLGILAMILLVKGIFWDDDDKPDDKERIAHNIMINKLMQLSTQAGGYINPVDTYNSTMGTNAVIQYFTDLSKWTVRLDKMMRGKDISQSGPNAGESGLWNQSTKTFMPGMFKDAYFGFGSQAERVFHESYYHDYFKSAEKKDKEANQRDRASERLELEKEYKVDQFEGETPDEKEKAQKKFIRQKLDTDEPTPTKLKKLGLTRDEYESSQQAQ